MDGRVGLFKSMFWIDSGVGYTAVLAGLAEIWSVNNSILFFVMEMRGMVSSALVFYVCILLSGVCNL